MLMQVKNLYTKNLKTINQNADLNSAEDMMNNYNIRHLPVVDDDFNLVGMLSKSDFSALKYVDSRLKNYNVKMFMSTPVKVVHKSATVKKVAQLFIDKKINSVIVADDSEVLGILTSEDLIRLLAENNDYLNEADQLDLAALADEGWISTTMAQ
jgi:acetoin utilization protein AcuB